MAGAVGIGGIVVLVWPDIRLGQSRGFVGGVLASQLACAESALGSVNARRRGKDENVLAAVAIQVVAAGLCLWLQRSPAGSGRRFSSRNARQRLSCI